MSFFKFWRGGWNLSLSDYFYHIVQWREGFYGFFYKGGIFISQVNDILKKLSEEINKNSSEEFNKILGSLGVTKNEFLNKIDVMKDAKISDKQVLEAINNLSEEDKKMISKKHADAKNLYNKITKNEG